MEGALPEGSNIPYTLELLSLWSLSNHSAGQSQPVVGRAQMMFGYVRTSTMNTQSSRAGMLS